VRPGGALLDRRAICRGGGLSRRCKSVSPCGGVLAASQRLCAPGRRRYAAVAGSRMLSYGPPLVRGARRRLVHKCRAAKRLASNCERGMSRVARCHGERVRQRLLGRRTGRQGVVRVSRSHNPSIERTHNGEVQLCASATPSAPLRSAHIER